jgi:hypothetical protein
VLALLAAVAVVLVGAVSAFATVREFFIVEAKPFARGELTANGGRRAILAHRPEDRR